MRKFNEFNEFNKSNEGVITDVKNRVKNFKRYGSTMVHTKEEVLGLLKALVNMNDGVEMITGGVKITRNDTIYYLYTNGKVVFPAGSEIYIDEDDAKKLFYEFIKKK